MSVVVKPTVVARCSYPFTLARRIASTLSGKVKVLAIEANSSGAFWRQEPCHCCIRLEASGHCATIEGRGVAWRGVEWRGATAVRRVAALLHTVNKDGRSRKPGEERRRSPRNLIHLLPCTSAPRCTSVHIGPALRLSARDEHERARSAYPHNSEIARDFRLRSQWHTRKHTHAAT